MRFRWRLCSELLILNRLDQTAFAILLIHRQHCAVYTKNCVLWKLDRVKPDHRWLSRASLPFLDWRVFSIAVRNLGLFLEQRAQCAILRLRVPQVVIFIILRVRGIRARYALVQLSHQSLEFSLVHGRPPTQLLLQVVSMDVGAHMSSLVLQRRERQAA